MYNDLAIGLLYNLADILLLKRGPILAEIFSNGYNFQFVLEGRAFTKKTKE